MASTNPRRPNILLVFADDLATWAIGAYGSPDAHTPILDALSAAGCTLENFFCTSPVCSPARASLLTGRIPSQHGVHDWIRGGNAGPDAIDFLEGQPALHDALAAGGYRCGMIGKWHLGASDRRRPSFERWYAYEKGGGVYYSAPMYRGSELEHPEEYLTDALANEAVDFIRQAGNDERPFYLNLSFTAPHYPWVDAHPQELLDLYADCTFDSIPREPSHPWLLLQNPETAAAIKDPESSLRGYFAAVSGLDRALGRVWAAISEAGLDASTLIAFVGDNGFNTGHHGIWGKGNGTLPQNMYDTSIRVPAIFVQPGRIPSGRRDDAMVSGYDLLPTLLDYSGLDEPSGSENLPGMSQRAALLGDGSGADAPVVVYDEYGPVRMIRDRRYKLVLRQGGGPDELFDLADDPDERIDLISDPAYAAVRDRLRSDLTAWFTLYADPAVEGHHLPVLGLGQKLPVRGNDPATAFVPMGPPGVEPVLE
ncbi:sulfatase-like hydrolase/transferase [Microbacterium sp. NPDC056044]|uniref:sulfatase-like hydrolase/transferase n=1 Tax=Microbacterium sp. NPDC056044 TaxID=3345690 RepID=UPI0035D75212